jgi:hypothetical protein
MAPVLDRHLKNRLDENDAGGIHKIICALRPIGDLGASLGIGDVGFERLAADLLQVAETIATDVNRQDLDALTPHSGSGGFADAAACSSHDTPTPLRWRTH